MINDNTKITHYRQLIQAALTAWKDDTASIDVYRVLEGVTEEATPDEAAVIAEGYMQNLGEFYSELIDHDEIHGSGKHRYYMAQTLDLVRVSLNHLKNKNVLSEQLQSYGALFQKNISRVEVDSEHKKLRDFLESFSMPDVLPVARVSDKSPDAIQREGFTEAYDYFYQSLTASLAENEAVEAFILNNIRNIFVLYGVFDGRAFRYLGKVGAESIEEAEHLLSSFVPPKAIYIPELKYFFDNKENLSPDLLKKFIAIANDFEGYRQINASAELPASLEELRQHAFSADAWKKVRSDLNFSESKYKNTYVEYENILRGYRCKIEFTNGRPAVSFYRAGAVERERYDALFKAIEETGVNFSGGCTRKGSDDACVFDPRIEFNSGWNFVKALEAVQVVGDEYRLPSELVDDIRYQISMCVERLIGFMNQITARLLSLDEQDIEFVRNAWKRDGADSAPEWLPNVLQVIAFKESDKDSPLAMMFHASQKNHPGWLSSLLEANRVVDYVSWALCIPEKSSLFEPVSQTAMQILRDMQGKDVSLQTASVFHRFAQHMLLITDSRENLDLAHYYERVCDRCLSAAALRAAEEENQRLRALLSRLSLPDVVTREASPSGRPSQLGVFGGRLGESKEDLQPELQNEVQNGYGYGTGT